MSAGWFDSVVKHSSVLIHIKSIFTDTLYCTLSVAAYSYTAVCVINHLLHAGPEAWPAAETKKKNLIKAIYEPALQSKGQT